MDGPREWQLIYLVIESAPAPWEVLELTRNGDPLTLTQRRLGALVRTVAEWPRSNPGRYELVLRHPQGVARVTVDIAPTKISMDDFRAMLTDLHSRLPASIVLSLQRAGGLAGIDLSSVRPATAAEELYRLKRAVEGTPERTGLREILPAVARAPHEILEADTVMVRSELLKRPRPASLVRALATASNVGAGRQPVRLPDERVRPTRDVYENRVVQACVLAVMRRLRLLQQLAARTRRDDSPLAVQLLALTGTLAQARRQARFLDDVRDLTTPPHRVTMVLLKRREYRDALTLLLELQRSLQVTLDDSRLLEPMDNLPSLFQTWCALQVVDVLLRLASQHGYEVVQQRLARTVPGSVLLQVLPDGQPLLTLLHRPSGRRVTLTPERTFLRSSRPVQSVSFSQRPDLAIEVKDTSGEVALWLLDPKYKLGSEGGAGGDEPDNRPTGKPKKVDIDKMHAYRDALRDAGGRRVVRFAAILYPGANETYAPGLAALSARPAASANLRAQLTQHLEPLLAVASAPAALNGGDAVEPLCPYGL
ncbi:hypothetical protein QR90_08770 [Deinococcus radiopugnans]|uniref:DUF2357 domain-containing protein n=1 Tax=Deinococcus radiopugnans TaxID=57497 RepID=A0A0A7KGA3_9DEIO|nr:hypothetical protein QR90_08770 [Deinococcus radiopugnans]